MMSNESSKVMIMKPSFFAHTSRRRALFLALPFTCLMALEVGACAASDEDAGAGGGGAVGGAGGSDAGSDASGGSGGLTGGTGGSTGGTGGGSDAASDASGGSDGGDAASDAPSDAGATSISGSIVDLIATTPVADMQVCLYQMPSVACVKTSANGSYTLTGVPANQEVLLEYTKASYLPTLVTVKTVAGPMSVGQFLAPTVTAANALATIVGVSMSPNKGHILVTAFQGPAGSFSGQDNVAASIVPKSGTGPYYLNASNVPDLALTATSTSGIGLFANVDPGDVEVTLTHFTKTCPRLGTSWTGSKPNASKVKIVAGYLTGGAGLECP